MQKLDLQDLLKSAGCIEYFKNFTDEDVHVGDVKHMFEEDLAELIPKRLARRRLMDVFAKRKTLEGQAMLLERELMMQTLALQDLLKSAGCIEYLKNFTDEEIHVRDLAHVSEEDLAELIPKRLARRRLMDVSAKRKEGQAMLLEAERKDRELMQKLAELLKEREKISVEFTNWDETASQEHQKWEDERNKAYEALKRELVRAQPEHEEEVETTTTTFETT